MHSGHKISEKLFWNNFLSQFRVCQILATFALRQRRKFEVMQRKVLTVVTAVQHAFWLKNIEKKVLELFFKAILVMSNFGDFCAAPEAKNWSCAQRSSDSCNSCATCVVIIKYRKNISRIIFRANFHYVQFWCFWRNFSMS